MFTYSNLRPGFSGSPPAPGVPIWIIGFQAPQAHLLGGGGGTRLCSPQAGSPWAALLHGCSLAGPPPSRLRPDCLHGAGSGSPPPSPRAAPAGLTPTRPPQGTRCAGEGAGDLSLLPCGPLSGGTGPAVFHGGRHPSKADRKGRGCRLCGMAPSTQPGPPNVPFCRGRGPGATSLRRC